MKKVPARLLGRELAFPWYHPDLARRPSRPVNAGKAVDFQMQRIFHLQLQDGYALPSFHRFAPCPALCWKCSDFVLSSLNNIQHYFNLL